MDSGSGSGLWGSAASAEELAETTDVELLKKAWRNEKAAPELLQFQAALVERSREQIKLMEENVEYYINKGFDDLVVSLYQMDLDRMLFLLRSYLRIRIQKIQKYVFHILKTDLWNRLSKEEQTFAERFQKSLQTHLEKSVLSNLPVVYGSVLRQATSSDDDDMVPSPELDTFVFCKTKGAVGAFQLDDKGDEIIDLVDGDLYVLRYNSIKGLVEGGRIDLV